MFSSYYPPVQVGGAEVYAHELAKGLVKKGHEVTVLTYSRKPFTAHKVEEPYELDGIKVELVHAPLNPRTILTIYKNLKNNDVLHLHLVHNYLMAALLVALAKVLDKKIVWTDNGLEFVCINNERIDDTCSRSSCMSCYSKLPFTSRLFFVNKFRLSSLLIRNYVDLLVAPSNSIKEIQLRFGFDEEKIRVIPNIVNIDEFKFTPIRMNKEKTIMFAGILGRVKGCEYLIRAFKIIESRIPDSKLIIAGDGPEKDDLVKLAEELNLEDVVFLGWIPHKDMAELYNETTVLVVPSIHPEPFGIVGIEAMATGRPVIGSNVGGIPDWIEDGKTGFLVGPKNPEEIAERVVELLSNEDLTEEMGENARRKAEEEFSVETNVEKILRIYERVTA